jgi:hypothetical protein
MISSYVRLRVQGLFALIDLSPDILCFFYLGSRITRARL